MSTPSGAKKRKRVKDVEKGEQLLLKKVPKLSHFFAAGSESTTTTDNLDEITPGNLSFTLQGGHIHRINIYE